MRRLGLWVAFASALAAGRPASAQLLYFDPPYPDTAAVALTGDTVAVDFWINNATGGLSAYNVTFFLDDARVRLVRADSMPGYGFAKPTLTTGSGTVTLAAAGSYASTFLGLAKLFFEVDAGAAEGSLISFVVNTLTAQDGATSLLPNHRTDLLEVCQALQQWGDLDASRTVNSRDALIAITHALGLPIGSFDAAFGDVDADSATTTRDALVILSHGIGLYTGLRVGYPKTNRCAPLEPAPHDYVVWRGNLMRRVAQGDTLLVGMPGVSGAFTNNYPTWAPDGSRIMYTQYVSSPFYSYDFIAVTPNGLTLDTLRVSTNDDFAPAWSPDGTQIAFVSYRSPNFRYSIYVMNADGSGQTRLTLTDTLNVDYFSRLSWSADGTRLAFRACNSVCAGYKLWTVNANNSGLAEVFSTSGTHGPGDPVWSPTAPDSILYYRSGTTIGLWVVAASGDTAGQVAERFQSGHNTPEWSVTGKVFLSFYDYPYDYYLRRNDGRLLRLIHGVTTGNDLRLSFRRPSVYVNSVSISPVNPTIGLDTPFTATVLNSDASTNTTVPVTWVSRNTGVFTVDAAGVVTPVADGQAYLVASVRGWRRDSTLVTVAIPQ
jgi:hypothetical protein